MRQTLVRLTDELVAELDARARSEGASRSRLIRALLNAGLREGEGLDATMRHGYEAHPPSEVVGGLEFLIGIYFRQYAGGDQADGRDAG